MKIIAFYRTPKVPPRIGGCVGVSEFGILNCVEYSRISFLNRRCLLLGFLVATAALCCPAVEVHSVDPFIGTDNNCFPGPVRPGGLVQPSPDTVLGSRELKGGYNSITGGYRKQCPHIYGFSQTHKSGAGCAALGEVRLLPFTAAVKPVWDMVGLKDPEGEVAEVGYYAVAFTNTPVRTEITASERVAYYRMTFGSGGARLLVDLQWGLVYFEKGMHDHVRESRVTLRDDCRGLSGRTSTRQWICRDYGFALEFDRPWKGIGKLERLPKEKADRYVIDFGMPDGGVLNVRAAISSVDEAGARRNLAADGVRDFDSVRAESVAVWKSLLNRMSLVTDNEKTRRIFSTALYHSLISPNLIGDADGRARLCGKVVSSDRPLYTEFSLWDTYRSAHPLYTLLVPEKVDDYVASLLCANRVSGYLPVIPSGGWETHCMIGNHSVPVVVDAYLKGFRGFDVEAAFSAVTNSLAVEHRGKIKEDWRMLEKYGYYPYDLIPREPVSRALETAYDDACAARFADALGRTECARFFRARASLWTNNYDKAYGLVRGRDSHGRWREPFDEFFEARERRPYDCTEADAWVYTFHNHHDIPTLMSLMGGQEAFLKKLDQFFTKPVSAVTGRSFSRTGMGAYVHANEPSHHIPYLYAVAGRPDKLADRVGLIRARYYDTTSRGVCGDEDHGAMSSWYIFTSLGFYPVDPCGGDYVLGAPHVRGLTLSLPQGKTFEMRTRGFSAKNRYVRRALLNGKSLTGNVIRHADIVRGGTLVFEMTDSPFPKPGIEVVQDRLSACYASGETAAFRVTVTTTNGLARSGTAAWRLDNFGDRTVRQGGWDLSCGNPFVVTGALDRAGFLRLKVWSHGQRAVWGVGYDVDRIRPHAERPADFDAYWASEKARLAREVPLAARCEAQPQLSRAGYDVSRISFATFGGRRVWGFMTVPKDRSKAPFRARVRICDAGYGAVSPWEGGDGEVTVTFNVFTFEPGKTMEEQKRLRQEMDAELAKRFGLPNEKGYNCSVAGIGESREAYYFHDSLLGLDRAVDWVAARPVVDPSRVFCFGSSQGGAFGLYVTYLNRRISRACFAVPACCGHYAFYDKVQNAWPDLIRAQPDAGRVTAERYAGYFDGINFAAGIRIPVRFIVGFSDTTCPPPGVYAAYNACPSKDKAIVNAVGSGHCEWSQWCGENADMPSWIDYEAWLRTWPEEAGK